MNVNHVVRLEQYGVQCANRLDVTCVTDCGISIHQEEITIDRYKIIWTNNQIILTTNLYTNFSRN